MIIGVNGLKKSGKDTVGDYLVTQGFTRASFAAPMKASAAAALGLPADPDTFEQFKNNPEARVILVVEGVELANISVRQYLQYYGTQAHRQIPEFGDNVWVDMMHDKTLDGDVVITDCRFENEAHWVKAAGGIVIKLVRDSVVEGDGHESEAELPPELVDIVVSNNAGKGDLYMALDQIVAGLTVVS